MARTVAELPKGSRITDYISLGVLNERIPRAAVDEALRTTGRQSVRQRDLPAHVVVYYLIALALYMQSSYREVLRCLLEGLRWLGDPSARPRVAGKSGISQARQRLGAAPLQALHDAVVRPVGQRSEPGCGYRQWQVVSVDGSTLEVADEVPNAAAFGRPGASRGASAFPQIRFVSPGTRTSEAAATSARSPAAADRSASSPPGRSGSAPASARAGGVRDPVRRALPAGGPVSPPRAAPGRAAAGPPCRRRRMTVDTAPGPWKAPSRGNRHAQDVRIAKTRIVRGDSPRTWKTLTPSRPGWPDHPGRRTRFPLFPHAHLDASALLGRPQTPTRPAHTIPKAKTNAVSIVTALHTEFLTVLFAKHIPIQFALTTLLGLLNSFSKKCTNPKVVFSNLCNKLAFTRSRYSVVTHVLENLCKIQEKLIIITRITSASVSREPR